MKRKLFKQISNEWRSNLWLAVELLIISTVLWFIMDYIGVFMSLRSQFVGLDTENVFEVNLKTRSEESPNYIDFGEDGESLWDQFRHLEQRLKDNPMVESVAYGTSSVYNYNFWGIYMNPVEELPDSATLNSQRVNRFMVSPSYARVFNMKGINGETPEQLEQVLKDNKVIVTSNMAGEGMTAQDLLNRSLYMGADSTKVYTVGAVIEPIKRSDYEPSWHSTIIIPSDNINRHYVRAKPEYARDFARKILEESVSSINYGNVYIADVVSFKTIRDNLHRDDDAQVRNMYICMGFLLVIVFLGILGTFWFRTQQRAKELAIRITAGATRHQLFGRLVSEGLLLLVVVTPVAIGIDALLVYNGFAMSVNLFGDQAWARMFIEAAIVCASVSVMIVAGILFPALRAMKIEPAVVLGGE